MPSFQQQNKKAIQTTLFQFKIRSLLLKSRVPPPLILKTKEMPKERRSRSVSFDRPSPFSKNPNPNPNPSPPPPAAAPHQFDEIRCPVCLEHPHNAVLLLCTSHERGCRPFLCDTSRRHSNCLDHYRRAALPDPLLFCPLCRGYVYGFRVLRPARLHMDSKPRSCSADSCPFSGNYSELRRHARADHPLARPSDADPARERDWRALERQRDFGDLISTLQSGFGDEGEGDGDGDSLPFSTLTFFLVLRFRGSGGVGSSSSVGWSNGRRSRNWRRGRVLWGESIVEAEAEDGAEDANDDGDDGGRNGARDEDEGS